MPKFYYILLLAIFIDIKNVNSEEVIVEDWNSDDEFDAPTPMNDPNEISTILAKIYMNLKQFVEDIPSTDWAILKQKWHNLDNLLITKFISDCEEFARNAHEKNLLKQFHADLKKSQVELRIAFAIENAEKQEEEKKQSLLQLVNSTISLFAPKMENDAIHCVGVLWGFEQTEIGTNEYKIARYIRLIRDQLHKFIGIVEKFPVEKWAEEIESDMIDAYDLVHFESMDTKVENVQELRGRPLQRGPYEMRLHFWQCRRRFEEFQEKFWDYVFYNHEQLKDFLKNAKKLLESTTNMLAIGFAKKEDILTPINTFIRHHFEPKQEHVEKCLYKMLWLHTLNTKPLPMPRTQL